MAADGRGGGGKTPRKSKGQFASSVRHLDLYFRLLDYFPGLSAPSYGHLELLLTLNNFPGLSAPVGESEIISRWNFLDFTRFDRVEQKIFFVQYFLTVFSRDISVIHQWNVLFRNLYLDMGAPACLIIIFVG